MNKIKLPTLAEVNAGKVSLAQLEAYKLALKKPLTAKMRVNDEYRQAMDDLLTRTNKRIQAIFQGSNENFNLRLQAPIAFQQAIESANKRAQAVWQTINEGLAIRVRPVAEWYESERVHLDAYGEFLKILEDSLQNPVVKKSSKATEMVKSLVELFGGVAYYEANDLTAVFEPVTEKAVKKAKSKQASDASRASHAKQEKAKTDAIQLYMTKDGQWNSKQEAVSEIAGMLDPKLLERYVKKRKDQSGNEIVIDGFPRTCHGWLTTLIRNNPSAQEKLTPKAQTRLKKVAASPRNVSTQRMANNMQVIKRK